MIQLSNIEIAYSEKKIVSDFSAQINQGEKLVLTGSSGTGKSSILKSIFGIVPINSGNIKIEGIELSAQTIKKIRSQIFYLHQDTVFHAQTVWESIAYIYQFASNKNIGYSNQKIVRLFEEMNLSPELMTQEIQNVSGGERQRIGIVIARLLKKPIWLLDEPTSSLDQDNKEFVRSILAKQKATICIVSHDNIWNADSYTIKKIENGGN